ncbi:nuclear transport factor 2 family protein [Vibrio sp. PP-XX7]
MKKNSPAYWLICCMSLLLGACASMQRSHAPATSIKKPAISIKKSTAVPVTGHVDQAALLSSNDPKLAENKRLVYDMWRTLIDAHDVEAAKLYLASDYIQHNPIADTGRAGVLAFFASLGKPRPIQPQMKANLVAIVAEKDLVALVQVDKQTLPHPYTTTWFDLFRIKNHRIVEHWDHGILPEGMTPRNYVPVTVNPDEQAALSSPDPQLAANKQRVYDMWRVLLNAQQVDKAPLYLAKDYIQHNPRVDTGLTGFMHFFRQFAVPKAVQPTVRNFVNIIAEGDLVILATVATEEDVRGKPYTTTWFDMFRVKDGKMAEHWDTGRLPIPQAAH